MMTNYHPNPHQPRANLVKSNSYHGSNLYYRRKLSRDTAGMMLPPPPSAINRISRASTMSTIMEKQHPPRTTASPTQINRNRKRNSANNNRISATNLREDDIPLALLAYKKGYTNMSPSTSHSFNSVDKPLSSSIIQSSNSQSSDISLAKKKKKKKKQQPEPLLQEQPLPAERKKKHVPYQIKTHIESSTSQSSTVVATPTVEKQPSKKKASFKKKWLSCLRKLLSTSSKK